MPAIFTTKTDGNYLLSTTDALANQSTYGYNINTGELNRGQENRPLVPYNGTENGKIIKWFIPLTKIEVFRWDENTSFINGPHYHIFGMGHFYPGQVVPEPFASFYFPHLQ